MGGRSLCLVRVGGFSRMKNRLVGRMARATGSTKAAHPLQNRQRDALRQAQDRRHPRMFGLGVNGDGVSEVARGFDSGRIKLGMRERLFHPPQMLRTGKHYSLATTQGSFARLPLRNEGPSSPCSLRENSHKCISGSVSLRSGVFLRQQTTGYW